MRGNKLHVDRTKKDTQRAAALAKGGTTKMFGKQAAGPDAPGRTGKVQTPAPGARVAKGGATKMAAFTPARPVASSKPSFLEVCPWHLF
jgi:hypothetical protein